MIKKIKKINKINKLMGIKYLIVASLVMVLSNLLSFAQNNNKGFGNYIEIPNQQGEDECDIPGACGPKSKETINTDNKFNTINKAAINISDHELVMLARLAIFTTWRKGGKINTKKAENAINNEFSNEGWNITWIKGLRGFSFSKKKATKNKLEDNFVLMLHRTKLTSNNKKIGNILIAFSPTGTSDGWKTDFNFVPVNANYYARKGYVHNGFNVSFKSSWSNNDNIKELSSWVRQNGGIKEKLQSIISSMRAKGVEFKNIKFIIVGYSLGAALAQLAAAKISKEFGTKNNQLWLVTYAPPKAFSKGAAADIEKRIGKDNILYFWREWDIVPFTPLSKGVGIMFSFRHMGHAIKINAYNGNTRYKKEEIDIAKTLEGKFEAMFHMHSMEKSRRGSYEELQLQAISQFRKTGSNGSKAFETWDKKMSNFATKIVAKYGSKKAVKSVTTKTKKLTNKLKKNKK